MSANSGVDRYVAGSTLWHDEIDALRPILRDCGLAEEIKWNKPCYTHDGSNILILQEMKQFLAVMFFKGALLSDPAEVLESQGPNSRSARRMCFTSVDEISQQASTIAAYVAEAIGVDDAGLEVGPAPELVLVAELQDRIDSDPSFRTAFEALTPGRQREYQLHVSSAKQPATRVSRVEKCAPKILAGKGFRDR
jgi:uncharacterized protein YdeI (YjbR/CyaY-like superfamily)